MSEIRADPLAELRAAVVAAAAEVGASGERAEPSLERPPRSELGDYSTNAALLLAPGLGEQPRAVAENLSAALSARLGDRLERAEVAGPGFLNLHLAPGWFRDSVERLRASGDRFGSGIAEDRARRVLLEFVSANPTGPVTVAAARHAAYGDSLARILRFAGHEVSCEYYLNDAGGQIRLFGASIAARMGGGEVPEGGYEGAYVTEIAARLLDEDADAGDPDELARLGVATMRSSIEDSLARFRVTFDTWASERELRERGKLDEAIATVREAGHAYERDGALWMRTTSFGDDKDRVIVRADGEPTYFAADIAYHRDKLERGAELMLDVLGADHHGYVARLEAIVQALGAPAEALEVQIMQLVSLLEGGRRAQMSKRRGEFSTLDNLIADIGVDAARFFLVQRSHDTAIDLDLELARKRSNDNPVYYVQYAHARICSILRRAGEGASGGDASEVAEGEDEYSGDAPGVGGGEGEQALEPAERALISRLLELPGQIKRAERRREPHGLAAYAREVASDFHAFYRDCPVVKAPEPLRSLRLQLCAATASVIATALDLLGIEAPQSM